MRLEVVTTPVALRNARQAWSERQSLIVTLDDGAQGEAAPLPGYSPDTLDECRAALAALAEPTSLDDVARLSGRLPAARFALETALLNRRGGLGLPRRALRRCRLVTSVAEAEGAEALKVKIGVPGDLELCAAVRARWPDVALRLDANGTLGPDALAAYARFDPELVEEPATLDARYPFPIALDERLQHMTAAGLRAVAGRVQALVLKPMTLGGAFACLALAREAEALGMAVCASHLFDGPIARAATLALAEALPGNVLACGI